jgi:acyl-CoA reductase-like NAD-dependent aldehyde dehydrogenase
MASATPLPRYDAFIDGRTVAPAAGAYFETVNPYTSRAWAEIARCGAAEAELAVAAAHRAFSEGPWPRLNASQRGWRRTPRSWRRWKYGTTASW